METQTKNIASIKGSGVNVPIGVMLTRVWYTLHCPAALCSLAHLPRSGSIKTSTTRKDPLPCLPSYCGCFLAAHSSEHSLPFPEVLPLPPDTLSSPSRVPSRNPSGNTTQAVPVLHQQDPQVRENVAECSFSQITLRCHVPEMKSILFASTASLLGDLLTTGA